jgi:hypothetical protein
VTRRQIPSTKQYTSSIWIQTLPRAISIHSSLVSAPCIHVVIPLFVRIECGERMANDTL